MATGTTTIDFGAFPGATDATVAVTGQAAIVAGSLVEAWIRPVATADHTADEHRVEEISRRHHRCRDWLYDFRANTKSPPIRSMDCSVGVELRSSTWVYR